MYVKKASNFSVLLTINLYNLRISKSYISILPITLLKIMYDKKLQKVLQSVFHPLYFADLLRPFKVYWFLP